MNKHFQRNSDRRWDPPRRAYGRIDSVELPTSGGAVALVSIDMIDADWLDRKIQNNALPALTDSKTPAAWRGFPSGKASNPFEGAPLFRLEMELLIQGSWFGMPGLSAMYGPLLDIELAHLETAWLELDISLPMDHASKESTANIYPALFSDPRPVVAKGKLVSVAQGKALSDVFSLAQLPAISTGYLVALISKAKADSLAAYDVGQGNASALMSGPSERIPTLYFDLGAGVYRNKHTTPEDLRFCFTNEPMIILSHWDADHWAGAYATSIYDGYPALRQTWVAPLQEVGPTHVAFAYDVLMNGGRFFTYNPLKDTVGVSHLTPNIAVRVAVGTGADRNGSGIVLAVENQATSNGSRSWILTGDCEYKFFMSALAPADPVAIVVPHHGADLHGGSKAPAPVSGDEYKRLVYSFGPNNRHGKSNVQHPTGEGVTAHSSWDHGAWKTKKIGSMMPGADVLATAEHTAKPQRGGVILGWDSRPVPMPPPCHGHHCTTDLNQS